MGYISLLFWIVKFSFFFYCTIFIKLGIYFPDTITKWFNWVETVISERGPFFVKGGKSENVNCFYLLLDFSTFWLIVSWCHCKVIQLGWNRNFRKGFLFYEGEKYQIFCPYLLQMRVYINAASESFFFRPGLWFNKKKKCGCQFSAIWLWLFIVVLNIFQNIYMWIYLFSRKSFML